VFKAPSSTPPSISRQENKTTTKTNSQKSTPGGKKQP
jgi:hypothetical protein